MPSSESKTTSSSDTTEHPGHLSISDAPGRKGKYLYIERGNRMIAIARFVNEGAVDEFRQWAQRASEQGLVIRWAVDGEEGAGSEET